jgi:hypothetical protein
VNLDEAIAAARAPRSCHRCGRLFLGSAHDVHQDGGRCLPGDCYGQLVLVDGAWMLRGPDAPGS